MDFYLDQAARFTDFLSKLFQMRGILLHVRQRPDDLILYPTTTVSPAAEQWLSELRLTSEFPLSFLPSFSIPEWSFFFFCERI